MAWQSIEGHDDIVQHFARAEQRGRLGHAYLFVGPSGVGKRHFAEKLAQTLLCEDRDRSVFEPCGRCTACLQVTAQSHADLIRIGRSSDQNELPIETIRQLIHDLGFKPARGRYKVAIVDDADDMNQSSANCFLKCLEEPPPRSLILLIGTSPEHQLATIRSRCQTIRFNPLPAAVVARQLQQSGIVADPAQADRLAAMSGGSLERARALADPELWDFRTQLARTLADGQPNLLALGESVSALVEAAGKETVEKRARAKLLFGMGVELFHLALRRSACASIPIEDESIVNAAGQLAERYSAESLIASIEHCLEADYRIDRMGSVPLVVEAWVDAIARRPS